MMSLVAFCLIIKPRHSRYNRWIDWFPLSLSCSIEATEPKVGFLAKYSKNLPSMIVSALVYLLVLCGKFLITFFYVVYPKTSLMVRLSFTSSLAVASDV